jgi:5-methylcytosine-specific restriction protein A
MDTSEATVIDERPGTRNPPWTRDELILALDLYFRLAPHSWDEHHSDVVALSELLNRLPIHISRPDIVRFRNPAGVSMKLYNFRALDPSYAGASLRHGSRQDEIVWNDFVDDPEELRRTAEGIEAFAAGSTGANVETVTDVDTDYAAREGRLLLRQHWLRERNQELVRRKKAQAVARDGALRCEACQFVFRDIYGDLGIDYIECHHTTPLAELRPRQVTRLSDLALLCANCHRMIHHGGITRSVEQLREIMRANQNLPTGNVPSSQ